MNHDLFQNQVHDRCNRRAVLYCRVCRGLILESTLGENGLGNTGSVRGEWGSAALMKNKDTAEGCIAWCVQPFETLKSSATYKEKDFLSASALSNWDKLFPLHHADGDPGVETTASSIAIWNTVYGGAQDEDRLDWTAAISTHAA